MRALCCDLSCAALFAFMARAAPKDAQGQSEKKGQEGEGCRLKIKSPALSGAFGHAVRIRLPRLSWTLLGGMSLASAYRTSLSSDGKDTVHQCLAFFAERTMQSSPII